MLDPTPREIVLAILSGIAEFERQGIRERLEEAWRGEGIFKMLDNTIIT